MQISFPRKLDSRFFIMVQPSNTKLRLEEQHSLVPIYRITITICYCYSIRGTWPRWGQHDKGLYRAPIGFNFCHSTEKSRYFNPKSSKGTRVGTKCRRQASPRALWKQRVVLRGCMALWGRRGLGGCAWCAKGWQRATITAWRHVRRVRHSSRELFKVSFL